MFTKLSFNSKLHVFLLFLVINFLKCNSEIDKTADNNVFLKYLFQKYGSDHNVLTFEGLEHLLENLNLGGLEFEQQHSIETHRPKNYHLPDIPLYNSTKQSSSWLDGSLLIKSSSNSKRESQTEAVRNYETDGVESNITFIPLHGSEHNHHLKRKHYLGDTCLSPSSFAEIVYNNNEQSPYFTVASIKITPSSFLDLCPALLVQIEQKACETTSKVTATDEHEHHQESRVDTLRAWTYAFISIFVISICGVLGIILVPLAKSQLYDKILRFLVALATGTLCGDALMHLLPHILVPHSDSEGPQLAKDAHYLCGFVFLSAFSMYFLEKMLVLFRDEHGHQHHHHSHNDHQRKSSAVKPEESKNTGELSDIEQLPRENKQLSNEQLTDEKTNVSHIIFMVVLGDGIHNFTDGLAIGAAFSVDIIGGMAISLAVLLHELPHELGDIALLLKTGMGIKRAMYLNLLSSVISFIGMIIGLLLVGYHAYLVRWIYAATAGIFMYIALCDLLPEISEGAPKTFKNNLLHFSGILLGGVIMLAIAEYEDALEQLFEG